MTLNILYIRGILERKVIIYQKVPEFYMNKDYPTKLEKHRQLVQKKKQKLT